MTKNSTPSPKPAAEALAEAKAAETTTATTTDSALEAELSSLPAASAASPSTVSASSLTPPPSLASSRLSLGEIVDQSPVEAELFRLRNQLAAMTERADTAEGKIVDLVRQGVAIPGSPPPTPTIDPATVTEPILVENLSTAPMWLGMTAFILPGETQARGPSGTVLNPGVTVDQFSSRTLDQWADLVVGKQVRISGLPAAEKRRFDDEIKAATDKLNRHKLVQQNEAAALDRTFITR